jgi:hypothetical protein
VNPHSRAIFWDGSYGLAFYDGVHCELRRPPRIEGLDVEQIDYAPVVGQRMVRERGGAWRDLKPAEQAQCDAVLNRMANAVRAVVC